MNMHKVCCKAVIAAASLCFGFAAEAQEGSDIGTNASPLTQPPTQDLPLPNEGLSRGYFFNLRPLGEDIGRKLADQGIYLTGRTFNEGFANVSGGIKRGALYEGFTAFGVDLDMNRIAGINGGSLHLLFNDLNGQSFQPYSGSAFANNKVFSLSAAARLNELSYEQLLFDDQLDIRVGRVPVGTEFDTSELYCEFVTGLCAVPSGYAFTKGSPSYLTASTAGVAQLKLPYSLYFNAGVYEDEPLLATQHHNDWPGEDWAFDKARGATIPVQFGYRTTFATDPYPRAFDIGGFYDTGDYSDPVLNTTGENRVRFGGMAKVDHGKSGVWLQAQQLVFRPDRTSERGVTLFAAANFTTSGQTNISDAFFVGASIRGPFESRPNDTLNFVVQNIGLSNAFSANLDANLALRGIHQTLSRTETYVEVNYGLALTPGITFKPFFTYILDPDQFGVAKPTPTNTHAVFVGAAISAFFPESLGLPRLGK
ncbi:MAG: carbohydrate porin [Methylocella sp.]